MEHLVDAIGDCPVISVSREPIEFGKCLIDTDPISYWNIYMQMLKAALISETKYVAIAEDDVLYTREHFREFRPPVDAVSYDRSRWSLFSWDPIYCLRQRVSNCSIIAPRELLIEALIERQNKFPKGLPDSEAGEVGRERVEKRIGVTVRKTVEWYCTNPIVQLNHPGGSDDRQKEQWKKHGEIKAIEIPYWGKAAQIAEIYNGH